MAMRAIAFSGTLYLGLLDDNKALVSGYRKVGNVYPFGIQVSTSQSNQLSALKESAGQNLHTKTKIDETTGSMTFREYDADVLAWAVAGTKAEMTGTGGTVSAESVTLISGEWVKLANKGVSAVTISGSVEDTDFEVNGPLGLIRMIPAGNLTAGATDVDYTYAAESGYQISIGSKAQVRVAMLLDGEDLESGAAVNSEFYSVVMSANALVELITDPDSDFGEMPFDLSFETPTGQSTPGVINGIPLNLY
jgi:hypothetical protein